MEVKVEPFNHNRGELKGEEQRRKSPTIQCNQMGFLAAPLGKRKRGRVWENPIKETQDSS